MMFSGIEFEIHQVLWLLSLDFPVVPVDSCLNFASILSVLINYENLETTYSVLYVKGPRAMILVL